MVSERVEHSFSSDSTHINTFSYIVLCKHAFPHNYHVILVSLYTR